MPYLIFLGLYISTNHSLQNFTFHFNIFSIVVPSITKKKKKSMFCYCIRLSYQYNMHRHIV